MEKLLIVFIAFLGLMLGTIFLLLLSLPFVTFQSPGNGEHTGYVTAVEHAGFPWKTYRAYVKTDTQSSQEDTYCVEDQVVANQLSTLSESRTPVVISYESHFIVPNWKCGGEDAIIVGVRERN